MSRQAAFPRFQAPAPYPTPDWTFCIRGKVQGMFSIAQLLKLKPGCEQEYKKRHDELWPEMADAMRKAGVSMAVYLHENLLFVFATARDQHSWDELDRDP